MSNNDVFANPQAPSNYSHPHSRDDSQPMTNDDFRKLLMTPSTSSMSVRERAPVSVRSDIASSKKKFTESAEKRKEKKSYYAALVKESKEREAELAKKYRDRAKERREQDKIAESTPHLAESAPGPISTTANFKAVAPGFSLTDNADRRRRIIEESKYLGGDLEHTHLVKGLDYALLQKIKAETEKTDMEHGEDADEEYDEEDMDNQEVTRVKRNESIEENEDQEAGSDNEESVDKIKMSLKPKIVTKSGTAALAQALNKSLTDSPFAFKKQLELSKGGLTSKNQKVKKPNERDDIKVDEIGDEQNNNKIVFKTKLSRNIYRVLFETNLPKSNELFLPNRMAYIVDLNDDETDVPITSIRSKADCPNNENNSTLTTNDIVINKLTQILSYLRHGKRDAKKAKKKGLKPDEPAVKTNPILSTLSIYDDIGDYKPDLSKKEDSKKTSESNEAKKKTYFSSDNSKEEEPIYGPSKEVAVEFIKNINEKYATKEIEPKKEEKKASGLLYGVKFDQDSYAECYPGTRAEEDVNIDSDDDADFSKMDLGNKKGPVNRWDFDTNEEYNDYMSNREAMPKAAFQYGLKMADGRKTRRIPGDNKNDKTKLDKEWTQISKIIDKRKNGEYSGEYKKPKY